MCFFFKGTKPCFFKKQQKHLDFEKTQKHRWVVFEKTQVFLNPSYLSIFL